MDLVNQIGSTSVFQLWNWSLFYDFVNVPTLLVSFAFTHVFAGIEGDVSHIPSIW